MSMYCLFHTRSIAGDLNIDLNISVKNNSTSSIYMNSGCDNCNNNTFFPNLNYHNFMVTNVCNTIYVYIYEKMYKNYINHFFLTIVYFLHHRIEWPHLTLSVSLNGQIRYFYWSKTKSIYILLHFHRKYRFSEKFTWVGKFVILYVQVLTVCKILKSNINLF